MDHRTCCVIKCSNNGKNSSCKFYSFPTAKWKLEQRNKWIAAVTRNNANGSPWYPKPHQTICSEHFIGGKKSDAEASPSYVPTIFPSRKVKCKKIDHSLVVARYNCLMKLRYVDQPLITKNQLVLTNAKTVTEVNERELTRKADKGCQADIYNQFEYKETTFICNRYIQNNYCDAEIQVEIPTTSRIVTINPPKTKKKGCGSNVKK